MLSMKQQEKYLKDEWSVRREIMDEILEILSDGQPHRATQIVASLEQRGFTVPKRLVNSVLFSEARRYVHYDHKSFVYQLREADDSGAGELAEIKILPKSSPEQELHLKARFVGCSTEYAFSSTKQTGSALFDVSTKGRITHIILNELHPIYADIAKLIEGAKGSAENLDDSQINARRVIEILLSAWARFEGDQPDGPRRRKAEEARIEWSKNARDFLIDNQIDNQEAE